MLNTSFTRFNLLNYSVVDVCNNTELLIESLIDILLDEKYILPSTKKSNIITIAAYVPQKMSKLIREIPSFIETPKVCLPSYCDKRMIPSSLESDAKWLLKILDIFKWRKVNLLSVVDGEKIFPYHKYFETTYELLKSQQRFSMTGKMINISLYWNEKIHTSKSDFEFYDTIYMEALLPYFRSIDPDTVTIVFGDEEIIGGSLLRHLLTPVGLEFRNLKFTFHDFQHFDSLAQDTWITVSSILRPFMEIDPLNSYFDHAASLVYFLRNMKLYNSLSDDQILHSITACKI